VDVSDESYCEPDFAIGVNNALLPGFVGEVNYSSHFTRQQLKAKYRAYLTEANAYPTKANDQSTDEHKIRTVMCIDLYYAGTGAKVLQTAAELHRSAVSVWILQDGAVETVVDWVLLS